MDNRQHQVQPQPDDLQIAALKTNDPILLEIEADPTIGYASIQNAVPIIRALRVTNRTDTALQNVEISINCNPRFAQAMRLRFDSLAPGESRKITPLDLHPDHSYLADLQESTTASISVVAIEGEHTLAYLNQSVDVLAYDQWAGTRALPELLAAFSMPNNPAIDILIGKASQLLREQASDISMNGYQSKNREIVWKQVSAIYSTLAAENLHYAEPPASFGLDGQKIRTPDRILEGRIATCLDLAMLFSSCLEQAGLRAVVMVKEGHAWVGVWLHQTCFPDPLTDDVQAVRKRVDSGEFLVFETTGIAHHPNHRPSLRIALEQGAAHLLEENSFRYAIDIHRARELQIKPLPSRVERLKNIELDDSKKATDIEPPPILPPLDAENLIIIDAADDTPEGRLAKWKSRLLDLTLRNRLLNFKTTKSTLQLIAPDLGKLEDEIADGIDFRIRPLPNLMEGSDPRSAEVHTNRGGRTPSDDMALNALGNRELIARVGQDSLDANLLTIFGAARIGLEEGGANTLYLALGMLRWTESNSADSSHLAPILLVPVSLQRQSVRSGFRLTRHDDETIINPTLLQMLRTNFEMRIPGLDVMPLDDKGVDVVKVLQYFRLAVREIPGWEVIEQAHLGIFSFTKYLMWKDLQDRTEQLKANRVVKHLIDHPGQAFERDEIGARFDRLDDTHRPQDIFTPMLSDSSQLKAICIADSGSDLVLEGPPGTGKSQTITNLIAHLLAKGKNVLFVSEKMAALEVVYRRLSSVGLSPFCLELHSSKARKSEILSQLGSALDFQGQRTTEEWNREAQRLGQLRSDLNTLVEALHHPHRNGLTAHEAIGTCIQHSGEEASVLPWTDASIHDPEDLEQLRETVKRIATLSGALDALCGHPLERIGKTEWTPTWQDELLAAARALLQAVNVFGPLASEAGRVLGVHVSGLSLDGYERLDQLANAVLEAPNVPSGVATHAHDAQARQKIQTLSRHGQARNEHWSRLEEGWTDRLAELDGRSITDEWENASSGWWPKSALGKRSIRNRLATYRKDKQRPSDSTVAAMLPHLINLNVEDAQLVAMKNTGEQLLQDTYQGTVTNWTQVDEHARWAQRFTDVVTIVAGNPEAAAQLRTHLQGLTVNDRAFLQPGATICHTLVTFRAGWRELRTSLDQLNALAEPTEPLQGAVGAGGAMERLASEATAWQRASSQLMSWCLWRKVREHAVGSGLQNVILDLESGRVPLAHVVGHFEYSYQNWWLKKTIDRDPVLRSFSSADHERKIVEFRRTDEQFQDLTARYVSAALAGNVPMAQGIVVGADSELGLLRRELQKKTRHTPVRQLIRGLPTLLPRLKPCLLMSPLSVAQYLDASHAQFDVVVFDEASQIPVWDAVGAIARGRQLIVVGDTKQLPPTNFFNRSTDADEGSGDDGQVEDLESILDECLGAGMNRQRLQWHYRSRHESLITFSNVTYYDSQLITFPSPVTDDVAVAIEHVSGVYDRGGSRTNRAEAEAIVDGIERHYLDATRQHLTLGVVTFNQPQQSLIESLLDSRRRANASLDKAISAQIREPLFIKNLENVQGDERDVIFFSITYGPDAAGKMTMNFGPLNSEGGQRRLNVAVSRARERVAIYSALRPEQIDLSRVRAAGVRDLKHYLEFALKGPRALLEQSIPTGREPDSPFETQVIRVLRDHGWVVHPQVGCSGYRIDIGVVDPRAPGRYLIGIECDGRTYHSGATARDRDRLRQVVLEGLGWTLYRIWSTDWWLNSAAEVKKLLRRLELALEQPEDEVASHDNGTVAEESDSVDMAAAHEPIDGEARDATFSELRSAYRITTPTGGKPDEFYALSKNLELTDQLLAVINAEGPIHENVLHRRLARAWGLERTGTRIVERLKMLTPRQVHRTSEGEMTFYWPVNVDPSEWTAFREASSDESSRRKIDEVCLQELSNGVLHVLSQIGSAPHADVAKSVCRLLGMTRVPGEAETRIGLAIADLSTTGHIEANGGVIRLSS
ncbi:DUF3320 domain-containing protein [Burkholderia gladioli]|uniref:DUF3320 domain-containing protein n=1 Tax=Burkholderia gladioli TaxID=28095 RepID=UPI0016423454|nr:DUF3320 domain-containing protein [Burkholderia gladioli]